MRAESYFERHSSRPSTRLDEIIALQRGVLRRHLHLIASACYPFDAVLRALAEPSFVLPAEGMPGARYLPGSYAMDIVERDGEAAVLRLFGEPPGYRASLQPHSGTQANQIVYNAVLSPGDCALCLKAVDGGHISHTVLISRRHKTFHFGLTPDGNLDYDHLRYLARREQPRLIIVGGSALPRAIDFNACGEIAAEVGAILHADISHTATFVAAGLHPSAFPACDFVTFNTVKNLRGPNAGVVVYRNKYARAVERSIFPTTQGGANESGMLAKYATFLEWSHRDIRLHAARIRDTASIIADTLVDNGIPLVTGGTDCHIVLIDLRKHCYSGAHIERKLEEFRVLANRNLVPGDTRSPRDTSGLRIGATNLAILEYSREDATMLAEWLVGVIRTRGPDPDIPSRLIEKYQQNLPS